jgi:hypothetical protein
LRDRRNFSQTPAPATRLPRAPTIMITTELGLTFERDGDHWRCMEHP